MAWTQEERERVEKIDNTLRAKEISDAGTYADHDRRIVDLEGRMTGLSSKVSGHIDNHVVWIMSATGIVVAVLAVAKFLAPAAPASSSSPSHDRGRGRPPVEEWDRGRRYGRDGEGDDAGSSSGPRASRSSSTAARRGADLTLGDIRPRSTP